MNAMFEQALGPSNLLENTETNMSGVQMLQLGARVRALREAGPPVKRQAIRRGDTCKPRMARAANFAQSAFHVLR